MGSGSGGRLSLGGGIGGFSRRRPFFRRNGFHAGFRAHHAGNGGTGDNNLVSRIQAGSNHPIIALLRRHGYRARLHFVFRVYHEYGVLLSARYRLLRHDIGVWHDGLRHHGADVKVGH